MREALLAVAEEESGGGNNFLVPNGTIVFEFVAFAIILFVLGRFVVPPITRAMHERAEMLRKGAEDAERAQERAAEAQRAYRSELAAARSEGSGIRDRARGKADEAADAVRRSAADAAAAEAESAASVLAGQREQAERQLRGEVGILGVALSRRILGADYSTDPHIAGTIAGYLEGLQTAETEAAAREGLVGPGRETV